MRPNAARVSPSAAAIARPALVLLPILTFLVPGVALALLRTPTYTADARVLVGGFDVETRAVPGYVEASQNLAATYSRLVGTPVIARTAAKTLGTSTANARAHISATVIPESPIIQVEGQATSERQAVIYADAAAKALLSYAEAPTVTDRAKPRQDYLDASKALALAQAEQRRLEAAASATAAPSAALTAQIAAAEAQVATAQLQADAAAETYKQSLTSSSSFGNLQLIADAAGAGSDRQSVLQMVIAAAVGLGLVAGITLATLVVNRAPDAERRQGTV
jgi:capsular polysaccharide biosynthesis protein